MKSLFPTNEKKVNQIHFNYKDKKNISSDVYMWESPEGLHIATHMIMPCPKCNHPTSLSVSEFDFESKTLNHLIKCPSRWKKLDNDLIINDETIKMVELNEKGKPIYQKCGWRGYIIQGEVVEYDC
jgi:hypothetical protein